MFFCEKCRVKNDWPSSFAASIGPCEECREMAECHDVPSSALPEKEKRMTDKYIDRSSSEWQRYAAAALTGILSRTLDQNAEDLEDLAVLYADDMVKARCTLDKEDLERAKKEFPIGSPVRFRRSKVWRGEYNVLDVRILRFAYDEKGRPYRGGVHVVLDIRDARPGGFPVPIDCVESALEKEDDK